MAKQIVTKNVKKRFFWISFFTMFLGIFLTFRYFGSYTTNTLGFSGASVVLKQVVNSLYYPLVTLGQYVLPYRFIYKAAEWILMLWYPFMNTGGNIESLLHFPLSDMVSLFVSATLFSLIFYVANRYKRYCYWIYIGLLYYIISFLPIALHLIHRYDTQIETRYLYTTTPAVGFLLACCLSYGLDVIHKKWRSIAKLFQLLIIVACIVFLLKEATITQREVRVSAYEGESMTKFITSLRKLLPKLPSKSILLIEGNKNYYFDNNTMPFKLGGGYVLSVLYYSDGVIPKKALVDEPFIQFGTQGIIQDQNKTFGYYWNREDLKQEYIRNRSFSLDQIRAYSYIGDTNMISDISEEIKNYLLTL